MLRIKVMQILMILRLELMLAMLACLTVADEKNDAYSWDSFIGLYSSQVAGISRDEILIYPTQASWQGRGGPP